MSGTQTASKAWAGALSGLVISLLSLLSNWVANGTVDPVAVTAFGDALGIIAEAAIMAIVCYVTVWCAPRNQDIEE